MPRQLDRTLRVKRTNVSREVTVPIGSRPADSLRFGNESKMITLAYLTTMSPSELGDELRMAGFRVFEALALSEVLYLCEHEKIDAVIVCADVPNAAEKKKALSGIVMRLNPGATAQDIQLELSLLLPRQFASIQ